MRLDYKRIGISFVIALVVLNIFILFYGYLRNPVDTCRYNQDSPCTGTFDPLIETYNLGVSTSAEFGYEPLIIIFISSFAIAYYFFYKLEQEAKVGEKKT